MTTGHDNLEPPVMTDGSSGVPEETDTSMDAQLSTGLG